MDILGLLRDGVYLGIKPGVKEEKVIEALECSKERHVLNDTGSFLLLYSPIEAHFFDEHFLGLVIKTHDLQTGEKIFVGSENYITNQTSLDDMIKIFSSLGIEWSFDTKNCRDKTVVIETNCGATVEFNAEEEKTMINRIHLWSWE